jgi:hypothetical protein
MEYYPNTNTTIFLQTSQKQKVQKIHSVHEAILCVTLTA